ncbi:Protein N-terminal glutamine amidohydrolase, alpha beta roll [Kalmanozyma brasiliensis GHG001]|uniref:Protein N-terminal glutamine amidohydrolase, alpha beta roll n=1 Tax=Kalmanozyma brasiliensis (strain GHG001) TaxID=1365824 RepID=UPI0028681F16|nr:Protein N-terminal glutamine amidohydrolase, alpha beta roll [Kalmanozyma brasiliensis GHG001]KAF6767435.1 Protein N-terminal glutamine amidohydrolase, alpha beta roll [Kalmanozyma brasiliensis GHG001]
MHSPSGGVSAGWTMVDPVASGTDSTERDGEATKVKRRKSLTQSIRARLSRSNSSASRPSSAGSGSTADLPPPVPPLPRSFSSNGLPSAPSTSAASTTPSEQSVTRTDLEQAWQTITPPSFPLPPQHTSCYCEENIYLLARALSPQLAEINLAAANIARRQRARKSTSSGSNALFVPIWDLDVVFISNASKTVLLYNQRASHLPAAGWPVIWDYHVVAVVSCHLVPLRELALTPTGSFSAPPCFEGQGQWTRSWVYDHDSRLSYPSNPTDGPKVVDWKEYNRHTFGDQTEVTEHFRAMFRSVPANLFEAHFASDRSHMRYDAPQVDGKVWHAEPPAWQVIVGEEARREGVRNNLMDKYVDVMFKEDDDKYGRVWEGKDWLGGECVPRERVLGGSVGALPSTEPGKEKSRSAESGSSGADKLTMVSDPAVASLAAPTSTREQPLVSAESRMGERIASPLFPAYLHASQQHRLSPATHTSIS